MCSERYHFMWNMSKDEMEVFSSEHNCVVQYSIVKKL